MTWKQVNSFTRQSSFRDPVSLVKPLKENATDEEKAAHQEKVAANTSKANRILVLVRHGQYNLQVGNSDRHNGC